MFEPVIPPLCFRCSCPMPDCNLRYFVQVHGDTDSIHDVPLCRPCLRAVKELLTFDPAGRR